ncbi:MAG: hypothetical protein AABZ47_02980 [Planctomycetota bacterium]
MTAHELYQQSLAACEATGVPSWPCPEYPGERDSLLFLGVSDPPYWAMGGDGADEDDIIPIDVSFAEQLLKDHFRDWLLQRGWQVQVTLRRGEQTWRLVDCLSFADGGGDRLDSEYPFGQDEFTVLCESVQVLMKEVRRT